MRTRSTFILSLLASAFWLTACVGADIDSGGEGGGTSKELLQVEIPTGVIPLQITESIDTKPNKLKSALASAPTDSPAPTTKAAQAVTDTAALSAPSASSASPATRADDPVVYTRAIVLQYDAVNGTLLNAGNTNIDGYTIGSSISTLLQESANCNIYVLAVNETSTSGADTQFKTETAFKEATYALYTKFPTPTDADIPLLGSLKGIRINRMETGGVEKGMISTSDGNSVKAELRRIAAKLVVNFTYEAVGFKTGTNVTIADYPTNFTLVEGEGNFPDPKTASFTSRAFTIQDTDGDGANNGTTSFILYVPDNRRGEVADVIRPTQKTVDNAPAKSTYLTFTATEKTNSKHQLIYRFYFGGNTTNDFNIKRNSVYTLNSAISQTAESDPRVSEGGLMPIVKVDPQVKNVSENAATLKFKVTKYDATVSAVKVRLRASTTSSFTDYSVTPIIDQPVAEYTYNAAALSPNTVYYYSASITATVGGTSTTIYGDTLSFSTNTAGMPVLKTVNPLVSAANGKSATATGNVVTGTGITEKGVVYSTVENFNHLKEGTRIKYTGGTDANFTVTLSGLDLGTTYYYRYYAINAQGVTYSSSTLSFRTNDTPAVPSECSLVSTKVNTLTFSAMLSKKDEKDSDLTSAGLKYWTIQPANTSVSGYTLPFSDFSTLGQKERDWTDLTAQKQYWYAFYSTNSAGTVYTDIESFSTSAAFSVTSSSASIGPQEVSDAIICTLSRVANATVNEDSQEFVTVGTISDKTVKLNMLANTAFGNTTTRKATVTFTTENELPIRSATVTINQYGVAFPATFADKTGITKDGQSITVSVASNIPWQVESNQNWCTVQSSTATPKNTNTATSISFTLTVAKNEDEAREATITVSGVGAFNKDYTRTFKVSQKGAGSSTTLTPLDPTENAGQDVNFGPPAS